MRSWIGVCASKPFRGFMKNCRTASAAASKWWNNLESEQPILRSDEYLPTGGMLIPSVLSQQAHMAPRCRSFQKKRLFSGGCLRFIYTDRRTCCATESRLREKQTSCFVLLFEPFPRADQRFDVCGVAAAARKTGTQVQQIAFQFSQIKCQPPLPRPSDGEDSSWAEESPLGYGALMPPYLMWQPILRGHWLQWPPQGGRSTYLCGCRQLSLPIVRARPRGRSPGAISGPPRRSELPCLITFRLPQSCVFTLN